MFILAFVYASSCLFLGFEIMTVLLIQVLDMPTIIGIGWLFGIIFAAWATYLLNLYIPLSRTFGIVQIISYTAIAFLIQKIRPKRKFKKSVSIFCIIFSIIFPSLFLSWFLNHALLYNEKETRGACYGDMPFHLNLISSFAVGCNSQRKSVFDIVSPFFAKEKLAYPIMPNYISAIILKCFDTNYHACLVLPSLFFGASIFIVLSRIVYEFSESEIACYIAPWLFLFTGGLGFIEWVKNPSLRHKFYTDFVHNWGYKEGSWFQTVVHILLPQRSSLASLPISYSIILLLIMGSRKNKVDFKLYTAAGLLIACLPQTQPHSIIAVCEYGVVFFVIKALFPFNLIKLKNMMINYTTLAIVSIILGIPQCLPLFGRTVANKNFMKISPIWKMDLTKKFIPMWYRSLGPLFAMSFIHSFSVMNMKQLTFYLPSVAVFAISNYVWYQPWHMDNTKVFNAAWLPLVLAGVSNFLRYLIKGGFFGKILFALLMVSTCFSGFLAVRMAYREKYDEWSLGDNPFELSKFVIENTAPRAIWITDDWHAHPVVALAGRQTVSGYPGWIHTHGLNSAERTKMIKQIQFEPNNTEKVDEFGVDYICTKGKGREALNFHPRGSLKWKRIKEIGAYKIFMRVQPKANM